MHTFYNLHTRGGKENMKKNGLLLLSATGALVLTGCGLVSKGLEELPERNKRVIVEVGYDLKSLDSEGVKNSQKYVYDNIKTYATSNVRKTHSYSTLVNAFVLEVNENDIPAIKNVPGVKSVTVDTVHWQQVFNKDDGAQPLYISRDPEPIEENISATTMNKPTDTNDGEGTIVAILDNEFHFRAAHDGEEEWHHEVYEPLDNSVGVRYTFDDIKAVTNLNAKRVETAAAGEEGSLYFNNKVPFYYDYGGESIYYGKTGAPKHDVHSDLSYHGSHVSSITAANAPTYKGIAPKAQLALMKVFTDFNAEAGIGETIGLSNSTGAYDSVILTALEDCIRLKVDGINMSLGSDLDDFDSDSITLKTLTKLHEEGILSAISAGNSGKSSFSFAGAYGNWGTEMVETGIMSSYANNAASTTVASAQPTKTYFENGFDLDANTKVAFEDQIVNRMGSDEYSREYKFKDLFDVSPTLEWVYVPGFGTTADYEHVDVIDKIAIVNRGSTSFADKYATARTQGAIGLVIINNDPTAGDFNFRCSFGDGFNPTMPCALVLYRDKNTFESRRSGSFSFIYKEPSDNVNAFTMSSFSTDGATFDLDLKPEIAAPGDSIKGAVPEHALTDKDERVLYKNKAYQYLSGTSMSAPNYAGAQSVVLSKKTGPIYHALTPGSKPTTLQQTEINNFRKTVDMRLMSTANPMTDALENPETNVKSLTSVRLQGAGMVDLAGALSTDVYLEGYAADGTTGLGKAKIALRNNPDIAKGDIKISFLAHNESSETRNYTATLSVYRPAIAHPNDIVTKDYNYMGEIESIESLPGSLYFDTSLMRMETATGSYAYKDAYKVSRDIKYFASQAAYELYESLKDTDPEEAEKAYTVIPQGFYYNAANEGVSWEDLPSYTAQSVQDVLIDSASLGNVSVAAGDHKVTLETYSLSEEAKKTILETYEYGCMIEGYVTLTSQDGHTDLSIPYLGYYSGADVDPDATYSSAPVVEPMNFEKDITKVYPSDLVNDVTKTLVGKDKVNFESMMVTGYVDQPSKLDTEKVLTNDQSFDKMVGFYKLGTHPVSNEYMENPSENLYLGSPDTTNTLIIQQFVLRSVADNYFTITNKATGEVVYKSTLEDMLFGDTAGKWALYKSHVDAGYLSAGYVAHRAYAIVPMYDQVTGEKFASGEYEIKFNYQLAATKEWVDKAYTLHIDSDTPEIGNITQYKDDSGVERVRFDVKEERVAYGVIGLNRVEAKYDEEKKTYYFDETKEFVDNCVNEISSTGGKRLFVRAIDYARGSVGAIIHFNDYSNFEKGYIKVQNSKLNVGYDFKIENGKVVIVDNLGNVVNINESLIVDEVKGSDTPDKPTSNGLPGWAIALIVVGGVVLLAGIGLGTFFIIKKKKEAK